MDVAETLRKVRGYKRDVLLLDLSMPGGWGLGAIPTLLEASPGTPIVILTMHDRAGFAHEALRAGACGFVRKEAADSELVDAVRAALVGDLYVDPRLGASMAVEREDAPPSPDELSDRELEVLKLLAFGHTNTEIADMLVISTRTVESHRSHVQHKLQRRSRSELVEYARERYHVP